MKEHKEVIPDKYTNFSEWYKYVLFNTDIVDDRYPVKGMYYYPNYGYTLIKNCISILEELLKLEGHKEERFPCLIPYSIFIKEKNMFEGFSPEAYLIEKTLKKEKLEEPLVVRPTSETAIYPMMALRIRSWKDLPYKLFQTVNIFRCETKMTKPLLRVREVMFFNEAHTFHKTKEEADLQIRKAIDIYSEFFDILLIPYFIIKIPEEELFPGAYYQYDFVTIMPDKKLLELGSVIHLGTRFSEIYDIKYLDEDQNWKKVWQTCYGISERSVGALISLLGDNKGLIIPPHIAPIQIVIVPILFKDKREDVLSKCKEIFELLDSQGYLVYLDEDDSKTPGWKYYYWELKGVPLRIEIGPRDIENGELTVYRRDTYEKIKIKEEDLILTIENIFKDIIKNLKEKALLEFKQNLNIAKSIEDLNKDYNNLIIPICSEECFKKLKEKIESFEGEIVYSPIKLNEKCIFCKDKATKYILIGKTY